MKIKALLLLLPLFATTLVSCDNKQAAGGTLELQNISYDLLILPD